MQRSALALVALSLAACARSSGSSSAADASTDASSAPSATASADAPPPPEAAPTSSSNAAPVDARRSRVTKLAADKRLAPHVELLTKHFGGKLPPALDVQTIALSPGTRHASLVSEAGKAMNDAKPILLVTDGDALAWSRDRPAAGITPPFGSLAIAAGPRGRVAMAVCDPPTSTIGLRLWDDDSSPFADFKVLEIDRCEDVSLLYWPHRGWVVVSERPTETRAGLVTEDGKIAWGPGVDIAARPKTASPVSLVADTDDSFIAIQHAEPSTLAFRYDVHGAMLWPSAIELAQTGKALPRGQRILVDRPKSGVVTATWPGAFDVELRSTGRVSPRARVLR